MSAPAWPLAGVAEQRHALVTRQILRLLFGPPASRTFGVRLWNGHQEGPAQPPVMRLRMSRVLSRVSSVAAAPGVRDRGSPLTG